RFMPPRSRAACTSRARTDASVTSPLTGTTVAPREDSDSATRPREPASRARITRSYGRAASTPAMTAPSPRLAPVTSATRCASPIPSPLLVDAIREGRRFHCMLVVLSEQVDDVVHLGGRPHRDGDPSGVGQDVVGFRPSSRDELVAQLPRKRQVGKGSVQMTQLAAADPELNPAETVALRGDSLPPLNSVAN